MFQESFTSTTMRTRRNHVGEYIIVCYLYKSQFIFTIYRISTDRIKVYIVDLYAGKSVAIGTRV